MATYQQILKSTAQGRRQLWYVCGSEPALVQDAYELAQAHVSGAGVTVEKRVFFGEDTSAHELEQEMARRLDADRQLIVLLNADKFKGWEDLLPFLKEADDRRFFVAVAEAEACEEVRKTFLNSSRSRYVVCSPFTPEDQLFWVTTCLNIAKEAARHLVSQARGDHDWLLNQIRRLSLANVKGVISLHVVRSLCPSMGTPDFATSLMNRYKYGALDAVSATIPTADDLDALVVRLGKFSAISDTASRSSFSNRLLVEQTGLTQKEISVFHKRAVYYDRRVSAKCYEAVVDLHEGLTRGSRQSYFALITRWA